MRRDRTAVYPPHLALGSSWVWLTLVGRVPAATARPALSEGLAATELTLRPVQDDSTPQHGPARGPDAGAAKGAAQIITSHLIPRHLLQLQKRPVRRLRVQEDDGHAVRAERRRREYSKAPTLEVSRGRGDIKNLVTDVVQAAGRVPREERRDR